MPVSLSIRPLPTLPPTRAPAQAELPLEPAHQPPAQPPHNPDHHCEYDSPPTRSLSSSTDAVFLSTPPTPSQNVVSASSQPETSIPASLTASIPTLLDLLQALPSIQQPECDLAVKVGWCRNVIFLINKTRDISSFSTELPAGPVIINDPQLQQLSQYAVPLVLRIASPDPMPSPMPAYIAEAIYLRATFAASGAYPEYVKLNRRDAFSDFQQASSGGHVSAWFRLGRDYEIFSRFDIARGCFERGVKLGSESCCYRMGLAYLMGQLGLPADPQQATPLLHKAATLASLDFPQPAYTFGLLLLNEFSQVSTPLHHFSPFITPGSSSEEEAHKYFELGARLNFAPAQYRLGLEGRIDNHPTMSHPYNPSEDLQGYTEFGISIQKEIMRGKQNDNPNSVENSSGAPEQPSSIQEQFSHPEQAHLGQVEGLNKGHRRFASDSIIASQSSREHSNTMTGHNRAATYDVAASPSPRPLQSQLQNAEETLTQPIGHQFNEPPIAQMNQPTAAEPSLAQNPQLPTQNRHSLLARMKSRVGLSANLQPVTEQSSVSPFILPHGLDQDGTQSLSLTYQPHSQLPIGEGKTEGDVLPIAGPYLLKNNAPLLSSATTGATSAANAVGRSWKLTKKGTKASWEMAKKGTKQINKATRKQMEERKSGKVMKTLGGTIKSGMDGLLGESLNSRSLRDALSELGEVGDNGEVFIDVVSAADQKNLTVTGELQQEGLEGYTIAEVVHAEPDELEYIEDERILSEYTHI